MAQNIDKNLPDPNDQNKPAAAVDAAAQSAPSTPNYTIVNVLVATAVCAILGLAPLLLANTKNEIVKLMGPVLAGVALAIVNRKQISIAGAIVVPFIFMLLIFSPIGGAALCGGLLGIEGKTFDPQTSNEPIFYLIAAGAVPLFATYFGVRGYAMLAGKQSIFSFLLLLLVVCGGSFMMLSEAISFSLFQAIVVGGGALVLSLMHLKK